MCSYHESLHHLQRSIIILFSFQLWAKVKEKKRREWEFQWRFSHVGSSLSYFVSTFEVQVVFNLPSISQPGMSWIWISILLGLGKFIRHFAIFIIHSKLVFHFLKGNVEDQIPAPPPVYRLFNQQKQPFYGFFLPEPKEEQIGETAARIQNGHEVGESVDLNLKLWI